MIEKGCGCALWKRKGNPYSCEGFLNFYITKKTKCVQRYIPGGFYSGEYFKADVKKREKMRKEMYEESKKLFKRLGI